MATVHQLFEAEMAQLDEISRVIGRIEQSVEEIKIQLKNGAARFEDYDGRMAALEADLNQRRGGWYIILIGASLIGAVAGLVAKFV